MATSRKKTRKKKAKKEDVISQLPAEIKERILECLPTRDAARTALLSTHWNDVWLHHGRLVFDRDFFKCVSKYYYGNKAIALADIINKILMLRVGRVAPVKKFTLCIGHGDPEPRQADIDLWCLFLSRNGVEELTILGYNTLTGYELPLCMVSCRTIKKLKLGFNYFYFPIFPDDRSMFPNVTSLVFEGVVFKRSAHDDDDDDDEDYDFQDDFTIPNLEKLAFDRCEFINKFQINVPKLESLSIIRNLVGVGVKLRWFTLHLKVIKTLCVDGESLLCKNVAEAAPTFPIAVNLQVIKLDNLSFSCGKQLTVAMQLLQKSPNLCNLEILATNFSKRDDKEAASRLMEDPDCSFINKDMKMLNTVKIERFRGSKLEMYFVKSLLSKSPALQKFVIMKSCNIDTSRVVKIQRMLFSFPRASPKAQILFLDYKPT